MPAFCINHHSEISFLQKEKYMAFISVFDVIGPNMVGPSSSHTAGAASIALLVHKMTGGNIEKVKFTLYGSFARTYRGHGTDKALLGGIMGFEADDVRIRDSFRIADEKGLEYEFEINTEETDVHPNTVDIEITRKDAPPISVRGESLGGGACELTRINGVKIRLRGDYHALIISHRDRPGIIAAVTNILSVLDINIAYLRVYRESKGGQAFMIIESDEDIPDAAVNKIKKSIELDDIMSIKRQEV